MLKRLGEVVYWAGTAIALFILWIGAELYNYTPSTEDMLPFFIVAGLIFAVATGIRYVLVGD